MSDIKINPDGSIPTTSEDAIKRRIADGIVDRLARVFAAKPLLFGVTNMTAAQPIKPGQMVYRDDDGDARPVMGVGAVTPQSFREAAQRFYRMNDARVVVDGVDLNGKVSTISADGGQWAYPMRDDRPGGYLTSVAISGRISDPGEPARAVHRARILATLERERSRPPITAAELRTRLYAHPRPRRALADGRLGPQSYAPVDPIPLP